jgi:SAM-dependent methyltransferase
MSIDIKTAAAFADSWNQLPQGSVYTEEQFEEWLNPLTKNDVTCKSVLEMGCGNGSLMFHMAKWNPEKLVGIDLGDSVKAARKNMESLPYKRWEISRDNLVDHRSSEFDLVYCIGVLHHLESPEKGFESVIRNVKPGGRFHCWVYAREGNLLVRLMVEPLRRITCRFHWKVTKYLVATPMMVPFFLYAKFVSRFEKYKIVRNLPLFLYAVWIAKRNFSFFQHVAFDQLVTPRTVYLNKETLEKWLTQYHEIDHKSIYISMRNGNSWKFGGRLRDGSNREK